MARPRLVAVAMTTVLVIGGVSMTPASAADPLPAPPAAWPFTTLQLGLADSPGGATSLHAAAPLGLRYQYLAGGVNTGNGWSTWNTGGTFVSMYVTDSAAHGFVPVFPYYMLLQSDPGAGADEKAIDLSNLANATTMHAYWADVRLFMQRAAASSPVVLHVEPDLWGYIEQAAGTGGAATVPASVASSGDAELAGLPNTAAGFAQAFLRLRDHYAPNVLVAYHLSVWGTMFDLHVSQTSDPETDALAAKAATFYASLNANFDLAFTDIADRDVGWREAQTGDHGASAWNASDFPRYGRFFHGFVTATGKRVVVWQIPLGNTRMRAIDDSWGHYRDNRVEWFLEDPTDGQLAAWRDDGVIGLLYGGGAGGTTCACDAVGDGVTDPAPSGTHTRASYSADDDGGYFKHQAAAYYAAGPLTLGPSLPPPPPPPPPTIHWSANATASPKVVARRHHITLTVKVHASAATRALVDVEIFDGAGRLVLHKAYDNLVFKAMTDRVLKPVFYISSTRALGTYRVKIEIYTVHRGTLLGRKTQATTFRVRS